MALYDSFVICTSPRSGSTLLCRLLAGTCVAGNPGSHFHDPSVSAWMGYYGLTLDPSMPERAVLQTIFDAAIAEGRSGTNMFGLRLQRHSFDFFTQKLAVLHPELETDSQRLRAAFGRTSIIHLTRRGKVEQAVSYVKAQQTGLWHAAPDGTELERLSPPKDPEYDSAQIAASFAELTAYDQQWESWFKGEGLEPFRITYEALSADPTGTLRLVLEHLGLDASAADGIQPEVAKLADKTSQNWAARFRSEHP